VPRRSNQGFGYLIKLLGAQGAVDRVATYVRQDRDNKDGRSDKKKQVNASEPRPGAESSMRLDQALYRYGRPSSRVTAHGAHPTAASPTVDGLFARRA